jgi:large subunit ribosomal protein L10
VAVIRPEKVAEVDAVRAAWAKASTAVLVDFRNVDVATITELRKRFRAGGVHYLVVKNSLVKQALKGTPLDGHAALVKHLKGQTGIAWSYEDPTAAAKIIKAFRKENEHNEKLQVKCGVLETSIFEGGKVESELATMPGKNEVRAALLAQLLAPMGQLVRQLAAAGQNLAYVLDARARQQEGQ